MFTYPLFLGLTLGVRHAADADHVATIATVVLGRTTISGALRTAILWGLGHTLTFLAVGLGIVMFGLSVPPAFELVVEVLIAASLIALGVAQLVRVARNEHVHEGSHCHHRPSSARALALGGMHGLAGSAGVALLALSTIESQLHALMYLCVFGLGTVAGMALITVLLAWSFRVSSSLAWAQRALIVTAGVVSCAIGALLLGELGWT